VTDRPWIVALLVAAGGNHAGAWRRPGSAAERGRELEFYLEVARSAERNGVDALFFADQLYLDVKALPTDPPPFPLDPMLVLAALASYTDRIGLVSSISTTFSEPYNVARQLATLGHLTGGRAGWNIVTSATGEANFSAAPLPSQEVRYARAREHVEIVKALWGSWSRDSLIVDRGTGRFADPARVRAIDYHGEHFDVAGPLNVLQPPEDPVLFQAGSSSIGRDFAASHAEVVFTAQQTPEELAAFDRDLRSRVARAGRRAEDVRVLTGITPIIGETEAEALALEAELGSYIARERALAKLGAYLPGVPVHELDFERPIPLELLPEVSEVQGRQSRFALFRQLTAEGWSLARASRLAARSDGHWVVAGAPEQIAASMERQLAGGGDGFVVMPADQPGSGRLFSEEVMPLLKRAGRIAEPAGGATLRDRIFRA